jgi:Leucine-rich repeat (LRR) protein
MHKRIQDIMKKIVIGTIAATMMLKLTPINVLANEESTKNTNEEITTNIDNKSTEEEVNNSTPKMPNEEKITDASSKTKCTNTIVNIPDKNLKKAINKELGQDENSHVTKSQLESFKSLNLGRLSIKNLEGIQYCTNLIYLNLSFNEIKDIGHLQHLTKLFTLNLDSNIINELTPLQHLYNLSDLSLSCNYISDLGPLKGLTALQTLNLTNNSISDLNGLQDLTSLAYLKLSNNNISDIANLRNLTKLSSLYLGNNRITNVEPLKNLNNIYYLYLSNNNINNVYYLENLTSLSFLHLSYNNISDLSGLKGLTNLSYLHLSNNNISDITALDSLTKLSNLYLGNNNIYDITALKNLTNLSTLDLSHNNISNVTPLNVLKDLKFLNLNKNAISNLSPLGNLNRLTEFSAVNQKIVLDSIKIDKTPIEIINHVINLNGTVLDISDDNISSGGTYDKNKHTITWNSVHGNLKYSFKSSSAIPSFKIPEYFRFNGEVIQPYEYVNNPSNKYPKISAENKALKIGDTFNPLEGVTAHDKEDGDITKYIKVIKNNVDINKVGKYKVTYQVADSKGATATKTISVIVKSNDNPVISGADDISIIEGESFNPLKGVRAIDTEDGNLTKYIKVIGSVDKNKPGRYELIYTVTDSDGNTTTVKRTVIVNPKSLEINSIPVINASDKIIKVGDKFDPLDGVSANDKEDGDITKNIKVIENNVDTNRVGTYIVKYQITDSKGATTTKTICVSVKSNNKPVIHGVNNIKIKEGITFNPMKGVTAHDKEDGDITKYIKVSGSVDENKQGNYELLYTVNNSDSNTTTAKRTVTVDPKLEETSTMPVINASDKIIKVGDKFDPLAGVSANDKEDGDITKNIKVIENAVDINKPGKYKVVYQVTNSKVSTSTKAISVTVNSKEFIINSIPEIKAIDKVINVWDKFDPLIGVKANDKEDGDITKNIKVLKNTVNVNKPGKYKVTYQVTDSQGASATKTITISVVKNIETTPDNNSENRSDNNIVNNAADNINNKSKSNTNTIIYLRNPLTGDMSVIGYIGLGIAALAGLFVIRKKMK